MDETVRRSGRLGFDFSRMNGERRTEPTIENEDHFSFSVARFSVHILPAWLALPDMSHAYICRRRHGFRRLSPY